VLRGEKKGRKERGKEEMETNEMNSDLQIINTKNENRT
jgi:hypothetical protein